MVFWKEKRSSNQGSSGKILKTSFHKEKYTTKYTTIIFYKNRKVKVKAKKKLGDKAYVKKMAMSPHLTKNPCKSAKNPNPKLTKEEKKFNQEHSKTRIEIERCFAYLKKV